jgi:HK97 gp10 family phage protein
MIAFQKLTKDLIDEVRAISIQELNTQADELVEAMQSVAPRGETGELEHSIRKVPGNSPYVVRVVAGGQQTIRKEISSQPYDYVRADEFGTVKMAARPFFFPTYRLRKKKMIADMKRRLIASIKKRSAE